MIGGSKITFLYSLYSIVTRGTGYETLQVSKAITKVLQFMLKSSTKVHNLLFYDGTLWLNNLTVTFLLVRCSCKIQNLLLFVHRQG